MRSALSELRGLVLLREVQEAGGARSSRAASGPLQLMQQERSQANSYRQNTELSNGLRSSSSLIELIFSSATEQFCR